MQWREVAAMAAGVVLMAVCGVAFFWWLTNDPSAAPLKPGIALRTPEPSLRRALTVWGQGSAVDVAAWRRLVSQFEKEAGEDVQFRLWDNPLEYQGALETAWAGEERPDVVLLGSQDLMRFRQAALIVDCDWTPEDVPHWVGAVVQPLLRGPNKIMAYPADFSVLALFYNQAIFDRVGLAYPGDHWTWETMVAISRALYHPTDNTQGVKQWALELPLNLELWQALAAQAGGGVYRDQQWLLTPTEPSSGAVRALQYLGDFFGQYAFTKMKTDGVTAFERGESAMLIAGSDMRFKLSQQSAVRWDVTVLPKKDFAATTFDFHAWAVSASSRKQVLAQRLAKRLAETSARNDWLPAYQADGGASSDPATALLYASVETAQSPFLHTLSPWVYQVVKAELEPLAAGGALEPLVVIRRVNTALEKKDEWNKSREH